MDLHITQILTLLTTLFTVFHSVSITWASLDDNGAEGADSMDECIFTCRNGDKPQKNPGYEATSNGCQAYGMKVDLSKLPSAEECCTKHDVCYATCNKKMANCDKFFTKCLNSACDELEEGAEECRGLANMMFTTVQGFGCKTYLAKQKAACMCPGEAQDKAEL